MKLGIVSGADLLCDGTASPKPASRGQVQKARWLGGHGVGLVVSLPRQPWDGIHEADRVGVTRIAKEARRRSHFDYPAHVHDVDPLAEMSDYRQIMSDEQDGQPKLIAKVPQDVQDARLHRDIERRHWLVSDEQIRLESQCPGDRNTLPLPAR